jgi:hypothetical protein
MHVSLFQWLLQFTHPAADHWTRSWAGCVNEIGDPNFPGQLRRAKGLPILIDQLKRWHCTIRRNGPLPESVHFDVTQPQ